MARIIPLHDTDPNHLAEVVAEMLTMGAPRIRAVWSYAYDAWILCEGTHRAAAASRLGLEITIDAIDYDDTIVDDDGDDVLVSEYVDSAYTRGHLMIDAAVNY